VPSFLILNKIDKMRSKRALLDLVKTLTCNNLSLDQVKRKKPVKEEVPEDMDRETEKTDKDGWADFIDVFMVKL
jgi:GTPase